jgi:hypothetical protein
MSTGDTMKTIVCDICNKIINENNESLSVVFPKKGDKRIWFDFCSWTCVLAYGSRDAHERSKQGRTAPDEASVLRGLLDRIAMRIEKILRDDRAGILHARSVMADLQTIHENIRVFIPAE